MRYTIAQFNKDFPNDDVCLDTVFENRYGDIEFCPSCGVVGAKFYRVTGRKCYACEFCGYQLHPLADTIFHKSSTPLRLWFYAIYLFSVSKNGVAAKELERHLGVTYKTAYRMAQQIRKLMAQDDELRLDGEIEADETYIGGRRDSKNRYTNKTGVAGIVAREGSVRAVAGKITSSTTRELTGKYVSRGSSIYTDESHLYNHVQYDHYHLRVRHSAKEYVRGNVHTNTIEGFWGQLKRSITGTYHSVSAEKMQTYVDEFCFRYNYRGVAAYPVLLARAAMHA